MTGDVVVIACIGPQDSAQMRLYPFRKSYPRVAVMQSRQNGRSGNVSVSLDCSTQRRILA